MSVQTNLEARVASLRGVLDNSNAALTNKGGGAVESLSGIPAAIQSLPSGGGGGEASTLKGFFCSGATDVIAQITDTMTENGLFKEVS